MFTYYLYKQGRSGVKWYLAAENLQRAFTSVRMYAKPFHSEHEVLDRASNQRFYIERIRDIKGLEAFTRREVNDDS